MVPSRRPTLACDRATWKSHPVTAWTIAPVPKGYRNCRRPGSWPATSPNQVGPREMLVHLRTV